MTRRIEIEIEGTKALAIMHDDTTPEACEAIWRKLPLEGVALMAKWACREIMLHLTDDMYLELKQEGPKPLFTAPGDIGYLFRGPSLLGAQREYNGKFQRRLCELTMYYGLPTLEYPPVCDPGRMFDTKKWEANPTIPWINFKWAHFEHPIPEPFYLKCEAIRHGRKRLTIRRYEQQA